MRIVIGPIFVGVSFAAIVATAACSDSAGANARRASSGTTTTGSDAGVTVDGGTGPLVGGTELRVAVPPPGAGRAYVSLGSATVVTDVHDPKTSASWDIAFDGLDVFTNSGASGSAQGGAFGPLDAVTFLADTAPSVPFLTQDKAGGAFLDWYAYDASTHVLWSRFHVFAVKDGARVWKVQLMTYYGERDGAPVSGLYKIRYAELSSGASGPTTTLTNLDGTAGGTSAPVTSPSECLDLGTGTRTMLTPDAALTSSAWHLCFRRATVSVNGESGGPRGIGAADLEESATASETVDQVMTRTEASELGAFDGQTLASTSGATFRGDRVVSAFGSAWVSRAGATVTPASGVYLVADAAGVQKYLVAFTAFENATSVSPGTVVMRIKPVKG